MVCAQVWIEFVAQSFSVSVVVWLLISLIVPDGVLLCAEEGG